MYPGKWKWIRDTQIYVFAAPKETQDIELEVFPRSKPQQTKYHKRNTHPETNSKNPPKWAPILKGLDHLQPLPFPGAMPVSLRECTTFSMKIQPFKAFWSASWDRPIWISQQKFSQLNGGWRYDLILHLFGCFNNLHDFTRSSNPNKKSLVKSKILSHLKGCQRTEKMGSW